MENTAFDVIQLEDQKLENVVGGDNVTATRPGKDGPYHFTGHVTKYRGIIGHRYFFTKDGGVEWYMGILVDSFEEDYCIFWTKRKHRVSVMLERGYPVADTITICGDSWTMFTTCDKIP